MTINSKCPKCGKWNPLDSGDICEWHICRRCERRFVPVEDAGIQCPECGTLNMLPAKQAKKGLSCISCGRVFIERGFWRSWFHLLSAPEALDSLTVERGFWRRWFFLLPVAAALGALAVVLIAELEQPKPGVYKRSLSRWISGGPYKRSDVRAHSASILVGKPGTSQSCGSAMPKPAKTTGVITFLQQGTVDYKNLGREKPALMLRRIHRAQQAYYEIFGRYGSLKLLVENGFLERDLYNGTYGVYEIDFPVFTSEKWCATLRPLELSILAGSTLKYDRSYYIDQTGIVRSASYKGEGDKFAGPDSEQVEQ